MRNETTGLLLAVLCLVALALPLAAQNASLVGTTRDPQQAAMPGVTVTLTNLDTGVALTTQTDATGNYEFPFVKPGRYSLKAEQKGFQRVPARLHEREFVVPRGVGLRGKRDAGIKVRQRDGDARHRRLLWISCGSDQRRILRRQRQGQRHQTQHGQK